jgi:PhnB protein
MNTNSLTNTIPNTNLVPYLTVSDAKSVIAFYVDAFGAKEVNRQATPDGRILHAALAVNGGMLMLSDDYPEKNGGKSSTARALGGSPVMISLAVEDADAVWAKAVSAGARIVMPLADQFWGDRFGIVEDPAGLRWSISTSKRKPSEEELRAGAAKFGAS